MAGLEDSGDREPFFVSSIYLLEFSKDVVFFVDCSSPIGSFWSFPLLIDLIDFCPQQGYFWADPWINDVVSYQMRTSRRGLGRCLTFGRVMVVSRFSIFTQRRTSLFVTRSCQFHLMESFKFANISSVKYPDLTVGITIAMSLVVCVNPGLTKSLLNILRGWPWFGYRRFFSGCIWC